jgi:hypothetical protein
MTKLQDQIRRIAGVAVAISAVALMSGCASTISAERRLERWNVGENKDLVLVRGVRPLNPAEFDPICKEGKLPANLQNAASLVEFVSFVQKEVCPNISEWRGISGFTKSDFGKGAILAAGLVRPGLAVDVDDIVESVSHQGPYGRITRPVIVARVIRKNALKERDPTCYWDGQSGRFDAFATGGVVCSAEGWDWRDQKWAKK